MLCRGVRAQREDFYEKQNDCHACFVIGRRDTDRLCVGWKPLDSRSIRYGCDHPRKYHVRAGRGDDAV